MDITKLNEQIILYCEKNAISGMLRLTVKDRILYQSSIGLADRKNNVPFTEDSMFSFYSLSKPFCAIGLLKLRDRGLIDIDMHPSKYVPEAVGFDERVTIRHLLHHTSGLPDCEQIQDFKEKYKHGYAKDAREHVTLLTRYPQCFPPGTEGKYANINFMICALIIENISKISYAEYMKEEVFLPLGMRTAIVDNESLIIPHRVKGYDLQEGRLVEVEKSHDWLLGAGDIVGTVDDVYCLNKAIKKRLLVCRDTWEEILTPSLVNGMGMGCTVRIEHKKTRIIHNGGHTGFRTLHVQIPEDDFDIIFLSNSGYGDARKDILEMIYQICYGYRDTDIKSVEMDKGYIK